MTDYNAENPFGAWERMETPEMRLMLVLFDQLAKRAGTAPSALADDVLMVGAHAHGKGDFELAAFCQEASNLLRSFSGKAPAAVVFEAQKQKGEKIKKEQRKPRLVKSDRRPPDGEGDRN